MVFETLDRENYATKDKKKRNKKETNITMTHLTSGPTF